MELGRVAGQVVATVRAKALPHNSLLLVELLNAAGEPDGRRDVALDTIGAGEGEWVILVRGSAASRVCPPGTPLDLAVVGIVDQVSNQTETLYVKHKT
jgi:microcompartment protein CcmK/EutM